MEDSKEMGRTKWGYLLEGVRKNKGPTWHQRNVAFFDRIETTVGAYCNTPLLVNLFWFKDLILCNLNAIGLWVIPSEVACPVPGMAGCYFLLNLKDQ